MRFQCGFFGGALLCGVAAVGLAAHGPFAALAPLPAAFALLAVEVLLRMRRLWLGERAPREDAVSAA